MRQGSQSLNNFKENVVIFDGLFFGIKSLVEAQKLKNTRNDEEKPITTGNLFVTMPYCSFGSLDNYLKNMTLKTDKEELFTYFKQSLDGLTYLHACGFVHLDIPQNILICGTDDSTKVAKLTDYGLSREISKNKLNTENPKYATPRDTDYKYLYEGIYTYNTDLFMFANMIKTCYSTLIGAHDFGFADFILGEKVEKFLDFKKVYDPLFSNLIDSIFKMDEQEKFQNFLVRLFTGINEDEGDRNNDTKFRRPKTEELTGEVGGEEFRKPRNF